jgi:hypothetical protein
MEKVVKMLKNAFQAKIYLINKIKYLLKRNKFIQEQKRERRKEKG